MSCNCSCRHSMAGRVSIAVAVLLFLCNLPFARAQETWIGPTAGIARLRSMTSLSVFPTSSGYCGIFERGWETPLFLGGQISLTPAPTTHLGLSGRILFSHSSGLLRTTAPESITFYGERGADSGKRLKAAHEYRLETTMQSLQFDFLLDYAITSKLHLHLGPSLTYVLNLTTHQSDYVTDPTYRFEGGTREQEIVRQDFLARQTLLIGAEAGISYRIPLGENLIVAPQVTARTDFTPLFQQATRFTIGPGIGVSVLAKISGGLQERDTIVDDVPPPDTPRFSSLHASITLRGTDDVGRSLPWARVGIYETMRRDRTTGMWRVEHRTVPPTLSVEPDYSSPNGIKEWKALFRYQGEVIGTSSSDEDSPPTSMNWKILDNPKADTGNQLTVELTVTDSAGVTVTTTDQLPLKIERLSRIVDDRGDSVLYTLYPVVEESAEGVRENNRALREIAQHAEEEGKIKIIRPATEEVMALPLDSPQLAKLRQETTAIADRLKDILENEEGKNVLVTTTIQDMTPLGYDGLPEDQALHSAVRIMVYPPR